MHSDYIHSINTGPEDDRFWGHFAAVVGAGVAGSAAMLARQNCEFTPEIMGGGVLTAAFTWVAAKTAATAIPNLRQLFRPVCDGTFTSRRASAWRAGAVAGALAGIGISVAITPDYAPTAYYNHNPYASGSQSVTSAETEKPEPKQ